MRRSDIRATITRLQHGRRDLAAKLTVLLSSRPIPKPVGHIGAADTDFLPLDLAEEDIEEIASELGDLEAALALE